MLHRGDIVIERLTARRAIVIHVAGAEEVTCRFADGRLEDRFTFELEPALSLIDIIWSLIVSPFTTRGRDRQPVSITDRVRPLLARQPGTP